MTQIAPPRPHDSASADWRVVYAGWKAAYDRLCNGGCIGSAQTGITLARVTSFDRGSTIWRRLTFVPN